MEIPRGGGRSKRLGVATLSGLLAVGLTPAFVTPAFAGAELGESENVVTLNGTDKLNIAAATATNTGLPSSDPDTKFDAKFKDAYQLVLKSSQDNPEGCAKTDPATGKTIDYEASNPTGTAKTTAASDVLTFTPQASNGDVNCTYTIEQTKKGADDKLRAGWEPDKAVYTFKVKATTSDGTSGAKVVKVADADNSVTAGKIRLLKDSNPATEGLVFKNTFSGVAFAKGDGTWKDNSINADYAIVPLVDSYKVPEVTPAAGDVLVGWKLTGDTDQNKLYTSEELTKDKVKAGQVYTAQFEKQITFLKSDGQKPADDGKLTGKQGAKIPAAKVPAASDDLCMTKDQHFLGWKKGSDNTLINFVNEQGEDAVTVDATAANNKFTAVCSEPVSQELKGTKTVNPVGTEVPEGVFQVELSAKTKDCPLPKDEKGQPKTTAPITKNAAGNGYEFNFGKVTFEKLQKCEYTFTEQAVAGQELEASKWGLANPVEKTLETEYTGGQFKVKAGYADPTFQNTAPVKVTFQAGENSVNFKDNSHEKEVFDKAGALGLKAAVAEIEKQLNPPAGMKLENFAGWKDNAGSVVEIGDKFPNDSTKVYTAVWSKDVEVKFYKAKTKDSDTPVLLGTQKLPDGKLLGKLAKNDKGQDVDLTVADNVCAAKGQALTGWSEKAAPGTKNLVLSAQNAAAGKEYTAQCAKPEVTFKGGKFAAGTNDEKTEQVVSINLGKNGVYDGDKHVDDSVTVPAVTVADDKKADGEHLKGWKLNDTNTIYSPDLKTIVSDGKDEAYKPVAGDKLTAVFGFKVVFHASGTDNKIGDPVGTEIVVKNGKAAGKFVSDVKVCTSGTHTSKWYVVTDNAKSSTEFTLGDTGAGVTADKEIVADCVDGATATITLKANGGQFKTDAQKLDINHYSMNNSDLVYTGPVGTSLKMTAPNGDDVLEARAGYKFAGWYPKADGTGTKFSDRGEDLTANQVFYAKWEEQKPVKVTVLNHLGKASGIPAVEVKYNDLAKLDGVDNTKVCPEGKTVSGWVNTADSENFDTTKPVTADVILRAVCDSTPETVTVSFVDAADKAINGADDKPVVYTVKYNTALTADQKAPEGKDAYCESVKDTTPLFDKWMADGKDFDPAMKFTKDTVVKAACKPAAKKIKVTLNSDKPESLGEMEYTDADTVAKITVPEGKQACTTEAAPQLNGWYQTSDNTKTKLADETPLVDGMNLTALCGAKTHATVTFKYGDNKTKTVSVELNKAIDKAEIPTEGLCVEGKEFKGWSDEAALKAPVTNDLELTAKCEAKTTPGGSTGGSTGGSSSGGSSFGGSFGGGSSTPSTPAKDKKPGDKKPGDKKPGAKQPVVNKFDKQFTKKVELPKSAVKRAAGADRVATSVAALSLAKNHEVVVLATGSNFPDALVGGALAGAYKAGVVLTTGATLEQSVLDSLKSYKTKTVHIVGGNGAVSLAKEAQLRAAGLEVIRHAGADRYATAQAVKAATLKALGGKSAISCNATGSNFPDALACSSAASQMGGVVDLVKPGTAVAKDATAKTVCAGGPACQAAGAGVDKVVGSDRYETAYKLAEMTPAKGSVLVSNGQSYADSLVAGALAGSLQADLVLAKPSRVNVPAGTKSAQLFGGTTVLPDSLSMYTK